MGDALSSNVCLHVFSPCFTKECDLSCKEEDCKRCLAYDPRFSVKEGDMLHDWGGP